MNSSSLKDSSFWKRSFSRRTISLWRTFSFSRTCLYFGKILPIKELLLLEEPSLSQNISSSFRKTFHQFCEELFLFHLFSEELFISEELSLSKELLRSEKTLRVWRTFSFTNFLFKESSLSQELFLSEQLVLELFLSALKNSSYLKYPLSLESSTSSGC